jgi:hypothetical protein
MGITTRAVFLVSLLANDATVWHSICHSRRSYRDFGKRGEKYGTVYAADGS